jgi:hypothetical protein
VRKREPKDFIGPTIKKRSIHCVPEGPITDLASAKSTQGVRLARMMLGEEQTVEGTIVQSAPKQNPLRKQRRIHCVPEGPTAELSGAKSTECVNLAKKLFDSEEKKVEGTLMKAPLQQTPFLPPGAPVPKPQPKRGPNLNVDPQAVVGMTHIDSYQTLMRNDRMEKPMVKGWQDEDS